MNNNEIRWKLHNYYTDIKIMEQLKSDLKEYRLMDGIKAQVITDMPVCYSSSSKIESVLEKEYTHKGDKLELMEYIKALEEELDGMMKMKRAIDSVYLYLQEPKRTIIEMRYFLLSNPADVRQRKYNWLQIAEEVNYSEDYCKEIDCKVILQIQNKIRGISHFLPI